MLSNAFQGDENREYLTRRIVSKVGRSYYFLYTSFRIQVAQPHSMLINRNHNHYMEAGALP
jgi:hypothetical protein